MRESWVVHAEASTGSQMTPRACWASSVFQVVDRRQAATRFRRFMASVAEPPTPKRARRASIGSLGRSSPWQ
eukprot:3246788-Pyramimonas_sp.AAC.1